MYKAVAVVAVSAVVAKRRSEVISKEAHNHSSPSSHDQLPLVELVAYPDQFTWCNKDGHNFCTHGGNQHIPQYCGACWAFATTHALQDRIKIMRKDVVAPTDIILSVQHVMNCGGIGTCFGGSPGMVYPWLHELSTATGTGISYEGSLSYMACSPDSNSAFCKISDWSCTPLNTARTCGSHSSEDGACVGLGRYPNATIVDFGMISGEAAMMREIYHRGPIACGVDAMPILNYDGGIVNVTSEDIDHVIKVVGWGTDKVQGKYWIAKNSWGEYWGDFGFFYVKFGAIALGTDCYWATPGEVSAPERHNQYPCYEDGENCPAATAVVQEEEEEVVTIYS